MQSFHDAAESTVGHRLSRRLAPWVLAVVSTACGAVDDALGGFGDSDAAGSGANDAGAGFGGSGGAGGTPTGGAPAGGSAGGGNATGGSGGSALGGSGGGPAWDAGVPQDWGAGGSGGGSPPADAGSIPPLTREEACARRDAWGLADPAHDLDGDCFVNDCGAGANTFECTQLTDCDDTRPDVNPALSERCNGRDDDCDGVADQTFGDIGAPCVTTCGEGKFECSVHGADAVVCSTMAGQSQAPDPATVREVCNGADDDCDGVADDDCREALADVQQRSQPVACGGRLFMIQNDALVEIGPAGALTTIDHGRAGMPDAPTCGPGGLAWLQWTEPCATPEGAPERCPGRIRALPADAAPGAAPVEISSPGLVGRPVVAGNEVLWHAVIGARSTIFRREIHGLTDTVLVGTDQSDPAAGPVAGDETDYIAVRFWNAGSAQVGLQSLRVPEHTLFIRNPLAPPGPPVLGAGWMVWPIPGALWAVTWGAESVGEAFQLVETAAVNPDPGLAGQRLLWLEQGAGPTRLQVLDLETGLARTLVQAEIRPGDYMVSEGVLYSVRQEAPGPGLYRLTLP
jgi:hypothetical protein